MRDNSLMYSGQQALSATAVSQNTLRMAGSTETDGVPSEIVLSADVSATAGGSYVIQLMGSNAADQVTGALVAPSVIKEWTLTADQLQLGEAKKLSMPPVTAKYTALNYVVSGGTVTLTAHLSPCIFTATKKIYPSVNTSQ